MAGQVKKEYGQGVTSSGTEKKEDDIDLDEMLALVGMKNTELKSTAAAASSAAGKKSTLNTAPTVRINEAARREANQRREEGKQLRTLITGVGSTVLNTLGRQINAKAEEIKRTSEQQFLATKMAHQQLSNLVKTTDEANQTRFRALQHDLQTTMEEIAATRNEILGLINDLNRADEARKAEILGKINELADANTQRMNQLQANLGTEIKASESRIKAKINATEQVIRTKVAESEQRLTAQIDGLQRSMDEYNRRTLEELERGRQERQREMLGLQQQLRDAQAAQAAAQSAAQAAAAAQAAQQAGALQQAIQRLRQQDEDNAPVTVYTCSLCGGANHQAGCASINNSSARLVPLTLTRAQATRLGAELAPDGSYRIQVASNPYTWQNTPDKAGIVRQFLIDNGITKDFDGRSI